jgi:hypothetical protein
MKDKATRADLEGLIDYLREGESGGFEEEWFKRCADWVKETIKRKRKQ